MTRAQAVKAEATGELVKFTFKGVEYEIDTDFDVDVFEYMEDGKWMAAIKLMLGEDQYQTFKKGKPKRSDLTKMVEEMSRAGGIGPGE